MSFSKLGLSEPILKAIAEQGYSEPTPIQKQAIPVILSKKDVLAGAQTGTGKTAGFTLPLLEELSRKKGDGGKRKLRALILTPTRELAAQVGQSVATYGKYLPLNSAVIFGGVGFNPQKAILKKGVDILTATPGRLLDHVEQKTVDLSHVEYLILDEADRMLDMGFIHDIKKVLAIVPKHKQSLLFSATFSSEIKKLADGLLNSPVLIEVAKANATAHKVKQVVYPVDRERKTELLINLIKGGDWKQILVFTRTKHGANKLSEALTRNQISATAIHGNKSQGARTKALADFKAGSVRVLVATDIAARGIDIDQLPHVINYELPNVPEDYVHRIGRTGRAGNEGEALSLVCIDEHEYLRGIERLIKDKIEKITLKEFTPNPNIKAEPIRQNSKSRGSSNKPKSKSTSFGDRAKSDSRKSSFKDNEGKKHSSKGEKSSSKFGSDSKKNSNSPRRTAMRSSSGSRGKN